jgi:hypothetical protein
MRVVSLGGGRHRFYREPSLRVDDGILKCVGFIGKVTYQKGDVFDGELVGTGFFACIPAKGMAGQFEVFVTAKHVVDGLRDEQPYILINKKGGGIVPVVLERGQPWWYHPTDPTVDVAVVPVNIRPDLDVVTISTDDAFLTEESRKKNGIGVGDEVFITGLFTPASGGHGKIRPIVRHGNIAMFPDEQIETRTGYADLVLVEARSIGGLSGSPAFVRQTVQIIAVMPDGRQASPIAGLGRFHFLGIVRGHWDVEETHINSHRIVERGTGVNMGIGMVVPAHKVLETISHPELVAQMEKVEEEARNQSLPKDDSAAATTPHERFAALARKVVSVPRDEITRRERAYQSERAKRPRRGPKPKR